MLWQRDEATGELVPLLVAGGGGGKAYEEKQLVQSGGGISAQGDGYSADTSQDGPGMRGLQGRHQPARARYERATAPTPTSTVQVLRGYCAHTCQHRPGMRGLQRRHQPARARYEEGGTTSSTSADCQY